MKRETQLMGEVHPVDAAFTRLELSTARGFMRIETFIYMALGLLLALTTLLGVGNAAVSLWIAATGYGSADLLVITIDRLLFVVMLVEILHTVRVSFSSRKLVCEPFLIVGLIASIRQVLVITLKSTQTHAPASLPSDARFGFGSTMMELVVLAGLILVMVVSIYLLRHSERPARDRTFENSTA